MKKYEIRWWWRCKVWYELCKTMIESASWIWDGILDMLKATKSKLAKIVRIQQPTNVEAPQEDDEEQQRGGERIA